ADGVHRDPVVLAHDGAALVDDGARPYPVAEPFFQQRSIAPVGHETDFLAFRLQGRLQLERYRFLAYLRLRPIPHREAKETQLILAKLIEHVGLVLALVDGFEQAVAARAALDAGVVAGRQRLRARANALRSSKPNLIVSLH